MPAHTDRRKSRYTPKQLYDVVADVENYPEYLPWVVGARIIENHKDYFIAELIVKFKAFSQKYSSKVILKPGSNPNEPYFIDVKLVKGPFKYLTNEWAFHPYKKGGSEVLFKLDFKFNSLFFEKMIGLFYEKAVMKMSMAFEERAEEIYGKQEEKN